MDAMPQVRERLLDADDLWEIAHLPENDGRYFELIGGVLIAMDAPGIPHGRRQVRLGRYLDIFVEQRDLGIVTTDAGHHPPDDESTVLSPDVAFVSRERLPSPEPVKYMPLMPDLAVEVRSPNDSLAEMRRKAQIYLDNGTRLVWLVLTNRQEVEVCRLTADGQMTSETIDIDGALSGEDVLPGFSLALGELFG